MKKILFFLIAFIFLVYLVFANNIHNPKSMALGDAYITRAFGFQALEWNPANLGLCKNFVTVNALHFDTRFTNNSISIGTYNNIVGDSLDSNEKQELFDMIPDKGLNLYSTAHLLVPVISFSIWKIGFSISEQTHANIYLPKSLFRLLLFGNKVNEQFDFSDSDVKITNFIETKIGYGNRIYLEHLFPDIKSIPPLYGGISMGLISGMGYAEVQDFTSNYTVHDNGYTTIENNIRMKTAGVNTTDSTVSLSDNKPAGTGFRANIGLYSLISENISVGLGINNLFGYISWEQDCEEVSFHFCSDTTNISNWEDSLLVDTTYAIDGFTQKLPIEIHLGGEYKYNNFVFALNYLQGFKESTITTTTPKISFGIEYRPLRWLPLRTGFGVGGNEGTHFSIGNGFALKYFEFNWAARHYAAPFNGAKGLGLSLSMQVKF